MDLTVYKFIFAGSIIMLLYIYAGYLFLLKLLTTLKSQGKTYQDKKLHGNDFTPGVTVYLSAFNEEDIVRKRLENLLALDYPEELVEIMIISDGSTDKTVQFVQEVINENPARQMRLIEFKENKGQAEAQNIVAEESKFDILLSTDAETQFPKNLLREIIKPFKEPAVGVVGGRVIYNPKSSDIGRSYVFFRSFEDTMQMYESALNLVVHVGGPCLAYRKSIWEPIKEYEDVDNVITLFARKKGYISIFVHNAVCYEETHTTKKQEILKRARMTRKALLSRLGRWGIKDILKHPGFTLAFLSHKILRYFSPFYIFLLILTGALLVSESAFIKEFIVLFACTALFFLAGYLLKISFIHKVFGRLTSFIYANIGFAIGIIQWMARIKKGTYKPTRSL